MYMLYILVHVVYTCMYRQFRLNSQENLSVLSGLPAEEIHVCGHESALPLVRRLTHTMGDELEVRTTGEGSYC